MALNDAEINDTSPPSPEMDISRHLDTRSQFSRDLFNPDQSTYTRVNNSSNRDSGDNDTEEEFHLRYKGTRDIDKIERLYRRPKSAEPISYKDKMYRKIKNLKHSNMHNDRIEQQFYKRPSSAKHVRNADCSNIITADIRSSNIDEFENLKHANETSLSYTDTSKHIFIRPMVTTENFETNDDSLIDCKNYPENFEENSSQQLQSDNQYDGSHCSNISTEIKSLKTDEFNNSKYAHEKWLSNTDTSKQLFVRSEVKTENVETTDDSLINTKNDTEILEENDLQKSLSDNRYDSTYCSNINTEIRSPNTDDFENIKHDNETSFSNTDTTQQIYVRSVVTAKHLENINDSLINTKSDPEKLEEYDLQKSLSDNQYDSTHCSNINITDIKSTNTDDFENLKQANETSFSNTDNPQQIYVRSVDTAKKLDTEDGHLVSSENLPEKIVENSPQQLPSHIQYDSTHCSNIKKTDSWSLETDSFENLNHEASILTADISKTIYVQSVNTSQNLETCDCSLVNSKSNTEIIEENSTQHLQSDNQNDSTQPDQTEHQTSQNQVKPSTYCNDHLCDGNMDENDLQSTDNNINLEYHNMSQSSSQQDLRYVPFDSEQDEKNFRERVYVHNVVSHEQTHTSPRGLTSNEKPKDEKEEPSIKGKFHTKSTGTFWQLSDKTSYSSNLDSLDRQHQDSESENQIETLDSELNEQTMNATKPKQERKGRSRLRNIIIRKRNCVSPSPAKHDELSRRSRSCPAFYKTFNANNSVCSSSVCCINSVHPIEESKHSPHFDSLNELNKQNSTLLNYPDCLTSVCCKASIHPVQENRRSLRKFDSLDKLDSQSSFCDDSNCKSLICCKNSVGPIREIGSIPLSDTHNHLESDSSCWDNSICTSSVCCKNSVVPIVMEAEVNEVENKSDECSSLDDNTKSISTLPTSETEEANGNNLPNVPDTTNFGQTDNDQTCSGNFAMTDKQDINNSHSSKEKCKEKSTCTITDSTEKVDKSDNNRIDNYDYKRTELKANAEIAHYPNDYTMESSQKQENFVGKNLCKHKAVGSDKSETNDSSFLCSPGTQNTENDHGIIQLANEPQQILFSSASSDNSIRDRNSNSQNLNCRNSILSQEQNISLDALNFTNQNKIAKDKETRSRIKIEASKSLNLQTTVENPDIVDRHYKRSSNTIDFETISEVGRSEDIDSKEVIKLGKKCRSISSANQERRRLGTPLTLILYVKKKCQSKIRKIMTSKNNAAVSKKSESQTQESDNNSHINIPTEETRTSKKAFGVRECDKNGNNIKGNVVNKNCETETKENIVIDIETPQQNGTRRRQLTEEEMVRLESFSRLDPSTLRVIGWSSGAADSMTNTPDLAETQDDENMCKLTKVEFRRLQDQVRDVSFNLRNRFRTSAYQQEQRYKEIQVNLVPGKKLYQQPNPTPLENATQLYRSQLAASLRAFKPKEWPPLNSQELETSYLRCKPINCQNDSHSSPPTRCSARSRPKSVPPSAFRNRSQPKRSDTPTDVRPGNFDSLNPRVLSHLLNDTLTTSSYGEIAASINQNGDEISSKTKDTKDDDVSTSGIESNPTDDTSSSDDEDDSDFEPEVDENRLAPELYLRPEKLDSLLLPDSAKGWRKFDFDADNVNIPFYGFSNPLPDSFRDLDLRQIARLKWNWRDQTRHRSREKGVDDILDRMVELERLQMETEDWEQKRSAQINKRYSKRAMSAKVPRDKRCCGKCLQPACTGDCPEKFVQSEICELCRQPFCVKTCADTKYEQRMRQSRMDEKLPVPKTPTPKYCKSCQTKHNAKMVNANNIVLGRPKSCNSTYSRGQASNKPKDYRPRSDTPVSIDMFQEFDKLGIDAQQPVRPTTAKVQRPRSRNSSFPSKSFYSQRRDSLTEADKHRFKKKSQKNSKVLVRRPKTAV
ncbi:interaptin-like isoform X4 [Mytilus californianus]|uniref:interaptin-like isoform X4 n=1 Tax=Mytilus californianus TaxID=6549 RepID=UPI0022452466|nr:interaptin-like isoform X4 [Mytilus californianus]